MDGTHEAYEVDKTERAQGSVEIYFKKHDIVKVKEADFVNTIIGEWSPDTDGKPSFKIVRDRPKLLVK